MTFKFEYVYENIFDLLIFLKGLYDDEPFSSNKLKQKLYKSFLKIMGSDIASLIAVSYQEMHHYEDTIYTNYLMMYTTDGDIISLTKVIIDNFKNKENYFNVIKPIYYNKKYNGCIDNIKLMIKETNKVVPKKKQYYRITFRKKNKENIKCYKKVGFKDLTNHKSGSEYKYIMYL